MMRALVDRVASAECSMALVVTALAALLAALTIPAARRLLGAGGWVDVPEGSLQVHTGHVPRAGGVGIALALGPLLAWRFAPDLPRDLGAALLLSGLVCALGFADDRRDLPPRARLAVQGAVALAAALLGFRPDGLPAFLSVLLGAVALVAVTNALNWLDGIDGLAGGVAAIASAALALGCAAHGMPAWRDAGAALCGALLVFLVHNFSSGSRKVFLGDCGSMGCGFFLGLAVLRLERHAGGPPLAAWLVLAVPLLELATTMLRRAATGRSLLAGDRSHTYDLLLGRGLSPRHVLLIFWAMTAAAGVLALRLLEA